ncbi:carboxymuconolactone decarboxylase family protein [Mesorhizobium erdmanii]|uniref:carboxymuconolactone decarboxylase family protein n=1 Tax=Mesorhizobium erdmanii TaxID=1777866 RepID=UPI000A653DEF|nr:MULTISPECIES: carboxymuconolactone decarboxylase family protein [Mesorhizobium]
MSAYRILSSAPSSIRHTLPLAAAGGALTLASAPAHADDYDATLKDIQSTMGGVPSVVKQDPKAGLPGAWAEVKAIELDDKTALPPKVKSLISLAVAAQIPCNYCIWSERWTPSAPAPPTRKIQEAVAMAAPLLPKPPT